MKFDQYYQLLVRMIVLDLSALNLFTGIDLKNLGVNQTFDLCPVNGRIQQQGGLYFFHYGYFY